MPEEKVHSHATSVPSATEFLEFARRTKLVNVDADVKLSTLLESADLVLRGRPGYVMFNVRCGLLIIERPSLGLSE